MKEMAAKTFTDDRRCDMCKWYDSEYGYCTAYHENHYPDDGEGCTGWKYWKEEDE